MSESKPQSSNVDIDEALQTVSIAVDEAILVATEQWLERRIEGLQEGVDIQITGFPLAEEGLRALGRSRIDEAQFALIQFRETGRVPASDINEILEVIKRHHWEDLVVINEVYPELDIVAMHEAACAEYDAAHAEHLQNLATEEAEYQDRMSGIRNATLERKLGEISEEQFVTDVGDQL